MNRLTFAGLLAIISLVTTGAAESGRSRDTDQQSFERAAAARWQDVFHDDGTGDWRHQWFLDGEVGTVKNTPQGMELRSGPEAGNDAHHMVLWTRTSFEGDVKIEYTFTRLDTSKDGVNIIYLQATGSGQGAYREDITAWSELRRIPRMKHYFDHMNTYHISYSVGYPGSEYTRARRYLPEGKGLEGTEISPDYGQTDLFQLGVPHRMTIIKRGQALYLRVATRTRTDYFSWQNTRLPPIASGRIGFRQMFTKAGRYTNVRIGTAPAREAALR
jgi:hypothetical protein